MPLTLNIDPNLLDFSSDIFAAARTAIAAAPNTTAEQAIEILKAGWDADIAEMKDQWAQQQQENQEAEEAEQAIRERKKRRREKAG